MAAVYTIETGQTLNSHKSFKSRLPWWSHKNVSNIRDCDVILAFCPVTSRVGTDIAAALRDIPEGKPLALVVLHHTIDSNYTVPDTRRFLRRPDSITADCLFNDDGLMGCRCNDDAVRAVGKFLGQHSKGSLGGKLALGLVLVVLIFVCVTIISPDFTFKTNISHDKNKSYMSNKTNNANVLQREKHFLLFYVKYITKDKCFLGVWGMQQCQTRLTTQQEIYRVKKKVKEIKKNFNYLKEEQLKVQQKNYEQLKGNMNLHMKEVEEKLKVQEQENKKLKENIKEVEGKLKTQGQENKKLNENMNSLKEEVENLKDQQQEKKELKENMNSLKEEVEKLKAQEQEKKELKENMNSLREEVEKLKAQVQENKDLKENMNSRKKEAEQLKVQEQENKERKENMDSPEQEVELEERMQTGSSKSHKTETGLVESVYESVFNFYARLTTTTQADKNEHLPESSQSSKMETSTDRAEERNDNTDEKDIKPDERDAITASDERTVDS